jgi:hypothetical protein
MVPGCAEYRKYCINGKGNGRCRSRPNRRGTGNAAQQALACSPSPRTSDGIPMCMLQNVPVTSACYKTRWRRRTILRQNCSPASCGSIEHAAETRAEAKPSPYRSGKIFGDGVFEFVLRRLQKCAKGTVFMDFDCRWGTRARPSARVPYPISFTMAPSSSQPGSAGFYAPEDKSPFSSSDWLPSFDFSWRRRSA